MRNTQTTAPGIKLILPGIPCAVVERTTQPGTPREITLDTDPSSTHINMNSFSPGIYVCSTRSYLSESPKSSYFKSYLNGSTSSLTHDMLPSIIINFIKIKNIYSVKNLYMDSNHPMFIKKKRY